MLKMCNVLIKSRINLLGLKNLEREITFLWIKCYLESLNQFKNVLSKSL